MTQIHGSWCAGSILHIFLRSPGPADSDIIVDGVVKQNHILKDKGYPGEQAFRVNIPYICAADPDVARINIPEPGNQHEVLQIVRKIAQEHNTCVAIIVHDLNFAIRYCESF